MGRGQKVCPKCSRVTGPRSFRCPSCNEPFVFKKDVPSIFKPEPTVPARDFDWHTLVKGDRIRVIAGSGPVWPAKVDGEATHMGYYGKFTVKAIVKDGILAFGNKKEGETSTCFIYLGPEKLTSYGLLRKPHKILKLKPKKVE